MTDINEIKNKFKRCILEYTSIGDDGLTEDDPNAAMGAAPADPMAGGAAPMDPMAAGGAAPADPMAGGAAPMGGDMNGDGMPDDPNAAAAGGAAPAAPAEAPGFSPQPAPADPAIGGDPNAMGADPNATPEAQPEEDNNDEIEKSQEKTEEKIDALSSKFERVMQALDDIEKRISDNDDEINAFKAEMEKRNPTAVEKMTIRSQKSGPFVKTPEEYWQSDAPENYSPEDDNNGVGEPQYEITKGDIDNITDWRSISKSLEDERTRMGLRDILGY